MVDFAKLALQDRVFVTYRCAACGEVDEYVGEMPEGWRHEIRRSTRRCRGLLVEVSRRVESRGGIVGVQRGPGPTEKEEKQMSQGMSLEAYMNHSTRGGGKSNYLKWDETATIWLSCRSSIFTLWRHPWTRVEVVENKDTHEKTNEIWGDKLGCYEVENVLTEQYRRDRDTGERDVPPQTCPHCKMIDDVYMRCREGNPVGLGLIEKRRPGLRDVTSADVDAVDAELLKRGLMWFLSPLFEFRGNIRDWRTKAVVADRKILHAGGVFNAFGNKNLSPEWKILMAKVSREKGGPIFSKNAYQQNAQSKCEYLYVVVDNDHPERGLQIAIETSLLGDKMKTEIAKRMKSLGREKGNPILHPYPFEWKNDRTEGQSFDKLYDATALETMRPTAAIEKLIRDTPPPDTSRDTAKFNLRTHRARLEKYAAPAGKLLALDAYFEIALRLGLDKEPAAEAEHPAPEVGRHPPLPPSAAPAPSPAVVDDEAEFACDALVNGAECGAPMKASDPVCPACGFVYDVVKAPEPPPPARPALPKRSAAKAAQAAPAAPQGNLGAMSPPTQQDTSNEGYPGDPMDDVPF